MEKVPEKKPERPTWLCDHDDEDVWGYADGARYCPTCRIFWEPLERVTDEQDASGLRRKKKR